LNGNLLSGFNAMEKKIPMTEKSYSQLQEELRHLKQVERPAVIRAISDAREHGDLSENAEYHAAKERQGFIEGRIAELEAKISHAEVIDVSKLSGKFIKFGATITLVDEDTEEEHKYQIVGGDEADVRQQKLSITSPLARALIGKTVGDMVEVSTPNGSRAYTVLKVEFK
jgi:transcription elongation factor GreA